MDTMSLRELGLVCAVLLLGAVFVGAQEQLPSAPQPQPNAGQQQSSPPPAPSASSSKQTAAEQQASDDQSDQQDAGRKPPSKLKRVLNRAKPNCAHIEGTETCWEKDAQGSPAHQKQKQEAEEAQARTPANQAPPHSEAPAGTSSSRETQIDLSPPPDDMTHEGADVTGVAEFHSYDPHKAAKNVEVGDFYFKRANYKAAESRYAEALDWKPNDAIATFRLAQSEEKLGKKDDAVKNYQAYLKILPEGEFAAEAKSGIARLKK
jgi:tetratricopeptide (TPR) repeat protein